MQSWLELDLFVFEAHYYMEATDRYGEQLAYELHGRGNSVSVMNPNGIKYYGRSKLKRTKNEKINALFIATYCQKEEPPLWHPLSTESKELQEMTRELNHGSISWTRRSKPLRVISIRTSTDRRS